ncbi:C45 family autoproteolytic acyltransferase/hydolase [Hamadaea tsunoensis]|uniref:C45 family autoproteolytic acyltransferase/hydolase n=1 Tax=Hamadaea tsunoensis TaxID=53368 RepID=UPI000405C957|nr:C45 family peptidase [Hamadaea tsunoensis]
MTTPTAPFVVDVSGTPTEMGHAYGVQAADLIRANIEAYLLRFRLAVGLDREAVIREGRAYIETTVAHFPRLAEMLAGVAAGAGVEPALIYAVNARSELLYGTPACGTPGGAEPTGECTVVGVLDGRTDTGHTMLAQNWDWHPEQRPYTLVLITRDERGHEVAVLTEAGMLAKSGLNNKGLGVCVNLLGSDRDGRPGGVPYHVLLRSVLEADSLSWALRNAVRAPRSASINLLIGQSHPDGGEVIDLELVPGDAGWLHPADGLLVHANHFETGLPVYDTIKDWGGSSLFRSARVRRLLDAYPRIGEKELLGALTDHHSEPVAVCRHLDLRDAELDRSETIWTTVMDLDERSLRLIPGPPCEGGTGTLYTPFS